MSIKKMIIFSAVFALLVSMAGCAASGKEPEETVIPLESTAPATQAQPEETQPEVTQPELARPEFPQGDYTSLLETYWTALAETWAPVQLAAKDLSELCLFASEGNGLANVGYAIQDVTGEGVEELIIGSLSPNTDKVIFDLYTVIDGQIVHLCSSTERNRYYLSLLEDTGTACSLINRGSSGAGNSEWASFMIGVVNPGELTVDQAIKYDVEADAENPWFIGYWDGEQVVYSPAEEQMARAIMDAAESHYYLPELTPFEKYSSSDPEQSHFYTDDELCQMALDYYTAKYDMGDELVAVADVSEDGTVIIQLYQNLGDHNSTAAWYQIDRITGKGKNMSTGDPVDLTNVLPDTDVTQ